MTELTDLLNEKMARLPDGALAILANSLTLAEEGAVAFLAKRHGRPGEAIREMVLDGHNTVLPEFKAIMREFMRIAKATAQEPPPKPTHEQRMLKEFEEIGDRIQDLQNALASKSFSALEVSEQSRMQMQNRHMCRYWGTLGERIRACQR